MVRTPEKAKDLSVKIYHGDYNDQNSLEKSLSSIDTLLLISDMDDPAKHIEQHLDVIKATQNSGVKKNSIYKCTGS